MKGSSRQAMAMRLDIDVLRSFATVAETGVLGRAADRLGCTQAAISLQMKRLEQDLSRPLLRRTGRGVVLTCEGERLLAHARNILRFHDDAAAELIGFEPRGSVRFGCPEDYAAVLLSPLLRSFARRYPEVRIEVTCAPSPRLREKLKRQLLDIVLVSLPDTAQPVDMLRREPLVWVGRKKVDVRSLGPIPLALSDRDTLDYLAATQGLDDMGKDYRIAYSSGSMEGLLAVVRSGLAITVLAKTAVPRDLAILRPGEGLPELPNVLIAVETDKRSANSLTHAWEQHLRAMRPWL